MTRATTRRGAFTRSLFTATAPLYDWLTCNEAWIAHCAGLADHFPEPSPARPLRVLDLGIGPGVSGVGLLRRRPDLELVGLDFSHAMLRRAARVLRRETGQWELTCGDAGALPFGEAVFDVVTHHSFLYLLADRPRALDEVARVLRPGGAYVLLEPRRGGTLLSASRLRGPVRFKLSMAAWRVISQGYGRFAAQELVDHGFTSLRLEETLGGLGWLVVCYRGGEL